MSLKNDSMEDFVQTATRGPKRGITEQILCHKLLSANQTDQVKRIAIIAEAAWSLNPEKAKEQKIHLETVEMLHTIATALSSVRRIMHPHNGAEYPIFPIMWGFFPSKENFDKYIKPWRDGGYTYYSTLIKDCLKKGNLVIHDHYDDKCALFYVPQSVTEDEDLFKEFMKKYPDGVCPKCKRTISRSYELAYTEKVLIDHSDGIALFFEGTRYLTEEGCQELRNQFTRWAQPIATRIEAQIAATIDPRTYQQYFQAQQREGGEQGEDSVDTGK